MVTQLSTTDTKARGERRQRRRLVDPLIQGLINRLPAPGSPWAEDGRKEWMATLEANLKLVYPNGPITQAGTVRPPGGG